MADDKQLAILRRGVSAWNAWRLAEPLVQPDLSGVNLAGTWLSSADFTHTNLADADLSKATMRFANLHGADLRRADLGGSTLMDSTLTGARLANADLTHAFLAYARFQDTLMRWTDLSGATLGKTIFASTDLSHTKGLDSCTHLGPSSIDDETFRLSGPLPIPFLRGCGLSDSLIDCLPSLFNAGAIQLYSCFISYSTQDQAFADRLHADLQDKGVRCWFAPHDMQGGKKIHEQIDEAIRVYDRLLLILSKNSMSSRWVKTEIARARQKEKAQSRRVLFPLTLVAFDELRTWEQFDADLGDDSAKEIREYYVPDFSAWKSQDAYKPAFDRLLKDLKAEKQIATQRPKP